MSVHDCEHGTFVNMACPKCATKENPVSDDKAVAWGVAHRDGEVRFACASEHEARRECDLWNADEGDPDGPYRVVALGELPAAPREATTGQSEGVTKGDTVRLPSSKAAYCERCHVYMRDVDPFADLAADICEACAVKATTGGGDGAREVLREAREYVEAFACAPSEDDEMSRVKVEIPKSGHPRQYAVFAAKDTIAKIDALLDGSRGEGGKS